LKVVATDIKLLVTLSYCMYIKTVLGDLYIITQHYDVYGGTELKIGASPYLVDLLAWVETHRTNELNEQMLRNSDPNVKLAWDSYKMAVALSK
jgi:hypothetical protein